MRQLQNRPRHLADSPAVLLIVYTPGPDADANGYEPWLARVDNPFFNRIPGVRHYANWRVERTLSGSPPPWTHFDFQALETADDLERVWFDPSLDAFRTEWIRRWGYGPPFPAQANAYLMQPVGEPGGVARGFALLIAGHGAPPSGADRVWRVTDIIRKHFATGAAGAAWRVPTATHNPLGLDWVAVEYGADPAALADAYRPGGETLALLVRSIAGP